MIVDKQCVQQVLGCLMKHPQYLTEIDKYNFTITDFPSRFEKYIFSAIFGLYHSGATTISPLDIENYLSSDGVAKKTFELQNGVEYLQDIEDFTNEDNFQYYYNKLKKLNLLKDLQKQGIDISEFYIDNPISIEAQEVNSKFEDLTIQDIILGIKKKLLKLESTYAKSEEVQVENFADTFDDFLEDLNEGYDIGLPIQGKIYNKIINGAVKGTLTIRSSGSGVGKAIPNYTIIPTPQGNRRVDEIKVGDYLWGDDGNPTKVIAIHPQPEKKEIYKVVFKDGRVAECCKEHLWQVYNCNFKDKTKTVVLNTEELIKQRVRTNKGFHFSIPLSKKLNMPHKDLYPLPYTMGALLGDGCFRYKNKNKALTFSSGDEEIVARMADELNANYNKNTGNNYSWTFKLKDNADIKKNYWVEDILKNYPDLWNKKSCDKFIPEEYLNGSIEQRQDLLRGLLDTDGSIDEKGRVSYFSNSKDMIEQVQRLCWSLGYIATIHEDTHKDTSVVYILHIQCEPQEKSDLFYLSRKREKAIIYAKSSSRKERRDNNIIVSIEPTGIFTEMTCFTVDNNSHLFLMNDYIVTHNTRRAIADAARLAYPISYNSTTCRWENTGNCEKVLFVITEQSFKEVKRMLLAYLTDINESRFGKTDFSEREKKVIEQAGELVKKFRDNFIILRIPDPSIDLLKAMVREQCILNEVEYVFYDYIFISPNLLNEFRGTNMRHDELLLLMATALKDLAVELNVAMFTSTQVNSNADETKDIRNEASLAGGRATINKADNGAIMARPSREELEILKPITENLGVPNMVTDIFKVRNGEWTQVRIWSIVDLGRMKIEDLFVTNSRLEAIDGFFDGQDIIVQNFGDKEADILSTIKELNAVD